MFLYLDFRMAFDTVSHSVSSGPEEGWLKWLDCLVVWTGWITGLRSTAQRSFVRRLKVEHSVKWYWGWCSVSSQRTSIIRQCSSIREGVNMLKDMLGSWFGWQKSHAVWQEVQNSQLCWEKSWELVACAEPEPTVSSQHNLYARLRQENMATRLREMIILFMLLRLQLQYCVWFWALWFQKDGKKLSRRGYKDG